MSSNSFIINDKGEISKEKEKPAFLSLIHELIHGDHYQRGVLESSIFPKPMYYNGKETIGVPLGELLVIGPESVSPFPDKPGSLRREGDITENDIREELGYCERLTH